MLIQLEECFALLDVLFHRESSIFHSPPIYVSMCVTPFHEGKINSRTVGLLLARCI